MSTPTVTEKIVPLEPVGRDDFMGSSQSPPSPQAPTAAGASISRR